MANYRRCANKHLYDADLYASCPYCNGQSTSIQFGAADAAPEKTVAPGMSSGHTYAPGAVAGNIQVPAAPGGTYAPSPAWQEAAGVPQNPEEGQRTIAPESYLDRQRREGHTIGVFKNKFALDPVVGWVVCVEGQDQGLSYPLYAKINLIGRGDKADVKLRDMTVSKEQVKLGYDVKHNAFHLIPGDSTNPSYLNDMPLYHATPIVAYDLIEVGDSKLMFIPFCGERFRWSDFIKQGE